MFNVELLKYPRFLRYKKQQRGSFKVIKYFYKRNSVIAQKGVISLVAQSAGFYNWKNSTLFQKRVGRLLKRKKLIRFRFNFSLNWSFSYKTHKSRMGKGKGVVNIDNWCSRIQGGKPLIFIKSQSIFIGSILRSLKRASYILPVSVLPLYFL